jgi:hypothetical protein
MRDAAVPGYRLSKAKKSTKVLITMGMLGLLLGLVSSVLLTVSRTGLSPKSVEAYYLGESILEDGLGTQSARPFSELIEVTHLHVLGGSMLLFLLCHLLSVSEVKDSVRSALYITSFSSFLLTFALPWLIIYVHPRFSFLFGASVVILSASLIILSVIPLREMWGSRRQNLDLWNDELL